MAKQILIKAKTRESKTPNALRAEGNIPATIYGHGFKSISVQINAKEFSKIPHKAYSHINELEIESGEKSPVLIRNVQIDPVRDRVLNVEFYKIRSDEKVKVKVSLNYIGHSPAVSAGGVLIVAHNEVEIQCLPKDIPDAIDVNLEEILEIGQSIAVKDLKIKDNIQILTKESDVLVKVEIPKTHEVEEAPAAAQAVAAEAAPQAQGEAATQAPAKETAAAQPVAKSQEKPAKK